MNFVSVLVRREVQCGYVPRLTVAVDATVPLLQPHRVPGHLVVHDVAARRLQVETLGRDVGGDEQADRVGGVVERLPDVGPLDERRTAERERGPRAARPRVQPGGR